MATKKKTQSISDRTPPVTVEYDYGTKGERRQKNFDDANAAKKFYTAKDKAGKNPKVLAASENAPAIKNAEAANEPEPKQPEVKKPTTPGVRPMRTRPYLAGVLIAKHGLAAGVTDEMVAELDELYGKANPTESAYRLRDAWHIARGYAGVAENAIE